MIDKIPVSIKSSLILMLFMVSISTIDLSAQKSHLYVGWAVADITPEKPVALTGQAPDYRTD